MNLAVIPRLSHVSNSLRGPRFAPSTFLVDFSDPLSSDSSLSNEGTEWIQRWNEFEDSVPRKEDEESHLWSSLGQMCPDWSHARDNLILAREASRIEDLERASVHISQACRITLGEDSYVSKMPFIFDQLFVAAEDVDLKKEWATIVLPSILDFALNCESLFPHGIPVIQSGEDAAFRFTRRQVASLIAQQVLGSMTPSPYWMPRSNFNTIYKDASNKYKLGNHQQTKLRMVFEYFRRLTHDEYLLDDKVSFHRQVLLESPSWDSEVVELSGCEDANADKLIGYSDTLVLDCDFANRRIGGGAIGHGSVQEEIMFFTNPDLICSTIFFTPMLGNECIFIYGANRFHRHAGYAAKFSFNGLELEDCPRDDESGHRLCAIVAMDALVAFHCNQFSRENIVRELDKAYCSFVVDEIAPLPLQHVPIATGNWGCGAFGGHHGLKALIQTFAACLSERKLWYFTFGDERMVNKLLHITELLNTSTISSTGLGEMVRYVFELGSRHKDRIDYLSECIDWLSSRKIQ